MLSHREKTLNNFLAEQLIGFSLSVTSQYVNELLSEFEVGRFEAHVAPRGPVKDEAEIYVDQVARLINHNIAVVAVFDLQNVAHYAVGCQASREVESGLLELRRSLASISFQEVLVKINLESFAKLIAAVRVRDHLNQATKHSIFTSAITDALVRNYVQVEIAFLEDFLEELYNLKR